MLKPVYAKTKSLAMLFILSLSLMGCEGMGQVHKDVLAGYDAQQLHEQTYYDWSQSRLSAYNDQIKKMWSDDTQKRLAVGIAANAKDGKIDSDKVKKLFVLYELNKRQRKLALDAAKDIDNKSKRLHEVAVKLSEAHRHYLMSGMSEADRDAMRKVIVDLASEAAQIYADKVEQDRIDAEKKHLAELERLAAEGAEVVLPEE